MSMDDNTEGKPGLAANEGDNKEDVEGHLHAMVTKSDDGAEAPGLAAYGGDDTDDVEGHKASYGGDGDAPGRKTRYGGDDVEGHAVKA